MSHKGNKIIFSMFNIIDQYAKGNNSHACCTTETFHERCACSLSVSDCTVLCTQDTICIGYVETNLASGHCQIATTSICPPGCTKYNTGSVGDLTLAGTCGSSSSYYGCFIKNIGNKNTVFKILLS